MENSFTLRTARELNRLTQKEAAKIIGVSPDTLSNYERGKSYPDIKTLKKIEKAYGVSYSRLIFLPFVIKTKEKNRYYIDT